MVLPGFCQKDCINGLSKEEAQMVKDIPTIEESIDGINSHITNMSSDIEDLQLASINFADHFDTLDGKVRNLETGLSELDDTVTEINNVTIANLSSQVNTLQNSTIPGLDARIGTIENSEIPDINSDISDINDAIDTINDTTIPQIQQDLSDGIDVVTDAIGLLDDRVTALENASGSVSGFELITSSDQYSLDKDKIVFVKINDNNELQTEIKQIYIPGGINPTYLSGITLSFNSYYKDNNGSDEFHVTTYDFAGFEFYSSYVTGVKIRKIYLIGGSGGNVTTTYPLDTVNVSNLGNGKCCIYQKK